jgi:hypothetical protein
MNMISTFASKFTTIFMDTEDQEIIIEKQKQHIAMLTKSSDENVISTLIELKEHGNLFYLGTLLDLVVSDRSEMLKKALVDFISDIKLQEAVPIISDFILMQFEKNDVTKLVTASWQSRLDFSKHLAPYFQVLIKGNYKIAFEAFTVIENSLDSLTPNDLKAHMALVKKGIPKADRDKQLLLLEMVSVIDKMIRAAN